MNSRALADALGDDEPLHGWPYDPAFVPTDAILRGDFSAFASAACNGGTAIALRAPFVNNTINPQTGMTVKQNNWSQQIRVGIRYTLQ